MHAVQGGYPYNGFSDSKTAFQQGPPMSNGSSNVGHSMMWNSAPFPRNGFVGQQYGGQNGGMTRSPSMESSPLMFSFSGTPQSEMSGDDLFPSQRSSFCGRHQMNGGNGRHDFMQFPHVPCTYDRRGEVDDFGETDVGHARIGNDQSTTQVGSEDGHDDDADAEGSDD